MVLDTLANASRYDALHPRFAKAFWFLARTDLAALPDGRHEIDGDGLYANVARGPGRGTAGAKGEAHRRYIDIQVAVQGTDRIGYRPYADCTSVSAPYDPDKDVELFSDAPATWATLPPGSFAIFFPEDMHAPLGGEGELMKVVVKVAVD